MLLVDWFDSLEKIVPVSSFQKIVKMNEEIKKSILQDLDVKIGSDIRNLFNAYDIENELVLRRNHLQSSVSILLF